MTTHRSFHSTPALAVGVQTIAVAGMAFTAIESVSKFFGHNGVGLLDGRFFDQRNMSIPVDVNFPVDLGNRLAWVEGVNGTVDAATGLPPVAFTGPFGASIEIWSPTFSERLIWLASEMAGPVFAFMGLMLMFAIAGSLRKGEVFTGKNQSRLWKLAFVVAIGGSINAGLDQFASAWIIERSAAAQLVDMSATFTFLPLVIGLALAMLASVWPVEAPAVDLVSIENELAPAH